MTLKARITAIDRFIKGCREDGIYNDLNACCVMAGWDSLAGALTPLKGAAPSNNGFDNTDYDRGGIGITGDETSYINSGFATNQLTAQDDFHLAIFPTTENSVATTTYHVIGSGGDVYLRDNVTNQAVRPNTTEAPSSSGRAQAGKILAGSLFGTTLSYRINGVSQTTTGTAKAASGTTASVFGTAGLYVNESLAFYSFGSATELALLDARVSTLMADLRAIEETGFDRDAIAYIRAVEEADGAYLETSVKTAINNLVSGLKADDGLWDAIGSSCLLCGPRTLAGALVPLRGDAPTPNGFVSGDHSRTDGLGDPDGTSYLVTGLPYNEVNANDEHLAVYVTSLPGNDQNLLGGGSVAPVAYSRIGYVGNQQKYDFQTGVGLSVAAQFSTGFVGGSRSSSATVTRRNAGSSVTAAAASTTRSTTSTPYGVFCGNYATLTGAAPTIAKLAFYSIGTSLDLTKLDSHITAYVTAIGAAL